MGQHQKGNWNVQSRKNPPVIVHLLRQHYPTNLVQPRRGDLTFEKQVAKIEELGHVIDQ